MENSRLRKNELAKKKQPAGLHNTEWVFLFYFYRLNS